MSIEEALQSFLAVTQSEDVALCRRLLEDNGGDLQRALDAFFAHGPRRSTRSAARPTGVQPRQGGLLRFLQVAIGGVVRLGFTVIRAVVRLAVSPLLGPGRPAGRLLAFSAGRSPTEDPATAARAFLEEFEATYGSQHPRFLQCSYRDALQRAQHESKFLLLYLHSAEHQGTPAFCAQTLCSAAAVEFIDTHLLCWGGDVRHSEAYQLSGSLRNSTFPYLALVLLSAGSRPSLVAAFDGAVSADHLLHMLAQAMEDHGATLVAARADAQERDYNRLLRAQQDAEYEASLVADRERAAREEALAEAAAREAAERASAAAAVAAAAAEAERLAQERAAALAARQATKAAALAPEPAAGPGVTQIVLRLPDGSRVQRRFECEAATLANLYDWAEAQGVQAASFSLVTAFPRTVYEREAQTLQAAGLTSQTVLLVEPRE